MRWRWATTHKAEDGRQRKERQEIANKFRSMMFLLGIAYDAEVDALLKRYECGEASKEEVESALLARSAFHHRAAS